MKSKSLFHSYTTEEGYHTAKGWGYLALAGFSSSLVGYFKAMAVSYYFVDQWSFGILAGFFSALTIGSSIASLRQSLHAIRLRKDYKRQHPEIFDSAGDEKS